MPGSALKIETTRRQLAVASGCLPGLVDSARYRRRFWSDFRPACRLSGSAGLPGSCLLLPAGSRLPGRSRLPGLTLRPPRHSTRQQLPYTLRCERFAFGCLIARGIKLLGHAVRRPALRLPRLDELEHRRGIGQLSPGQHRPRDAMFRHRPEAPVQMDPHFLARRRRGQKQGRR